MGNEPKVSVILSSYNHGKYIAEAIRSVLNQTYRDFELLIFDDGSSDNSREVIRSFHDERIRLFLNEENRGANVCARETISAARGQYIAIHHSDDVWEAEKLEKQVAFLDGHSSEFGVVFSYASIIDENGDAFQEDEHFYARVFMQENRSRQAWLHHLFYEGNCLCHPSAMLRRECYEKLGAYDDRYFQLPDFEFWIRVCLNFEIYILPEKLVRFRVRQNEANVSGSRLENLIRNDNEMLSVLRDFASIDSENDFFATFPAFAYLKSDAGFVSSYVFALVCLDKSLGRVYHCFGLQLLYELMGKPDMRKRLKDVYGFTPTQLYALAQSYDLFGFCEAELQNPLVSVQNDAAAAGILTERIWLRNDCVHIRLFIGPELAGQPLYIRPLRDCWPCAFAQMTARIDGSAAALGVMNDASFVWEGNWFSSGTVLQLSGASVHSGWLEISYRVSFLPWNAAEAITKEQEQHVLSLHRDMEFLRSQGERELFRIQQQWDTERNTMQQQWDAERNAMQQQWDAQRNELQQYGDALEVERAGLAQELSEIRASRGYRMLQHVYRCRDFVQHIFHR